MACNKNFLFTVYVFCVSFFALPASAAPTLAFMSKPVVTIFADATQWLLSVAGGLGLFALILGGVYYILSGANPQNQATAKKIITFALIGLMVVLMSYAIIIVINRIATQ